MAGISLAEIIDHNSFNLCSETETLYVDFLLIFQFVVKIIKTIKKQIRHGFHFKHPSWRMHALINIFISSNDPWETFLSDIKI